MLSRISLCSVMHASHKTACCCPMCMLLTIVHAKSVFFIQFLGTTKLKVFRNIHSLAIYSVKYMYHIIYIDLF